MFTILIPVYKVNRIVICVVSLFCFYDWFDPPSVDFYQFTSSDDRIRFPLCLTSPYSKAKLTGFVRKVAWEPIPFAPYFMIETGGKPVEKDAEILQYGVSFHPFFFRLFWSPEYLIQFSISTLFEYVYLSGLHEYFVVHSRSLDSAEAGEALEYNRSQILCGTPISLDQDHFRWFLESRRLFAFQLSLLSASLPDIVERVRGVSSYSEFIPKNQVSDHSYSQLFICFS